MSGEERDLPTFSGQMMSGPSLTHSLSFYDRCFVGYRWSAPACVRQLRNLHCLETRLRIEGTPVPHLLFLCWLFLFTER